MAPAAPLPAERDRVLILDFGSQYTQLIARRIREQHVYCEIHPGDHRRSRPSAPSTRAGIVLSGGPASVLDPGAPDLDLAHPRARRARCSASATACSCSRTGSAALVETADEREYGRALLKLERDDALFAGLPRRRRARGLDEPRRPRAAPARRASPCSARSENSPVRGRRATRRARSAACSSTPRWRTPRAARSCSRNFVRAHLRLRAAPGRWRPSSSEAIARGPRAGRRAARVICGLSGGVDSSVAAALVHRAIGDAPAPASSSTTACCGRASASEVEQLFREQPRHRSRHACDAERALPRGAARRDRPRAQAQDHRPPLHRGLRGGGRRSIGGADFLVQGTLYPDVIESVSVQGPLGDDQDATTTSAACPSGCTCALVEPLRELFKDEVREVGRRARAARATLLGRQPFPGPGLAVRVLGEVTRRAARDRCARADAIVDEEIRARRPLRRSSGRPSRCSCRCRASA